LIINHYVIFLIISTVLSATATVYTYQRRAAAGATSLIWLQLATTIWSFAYMLELANTELQTMYFWLKIEYLGIAFMSLWCLRFALLYTGQDKWLTRQKTAALSVIPTLTLFLHWTNEWHGLFYSKVELGISHGMAVLVLSKGAWYWVHIANFYISFSAMVFLILQMCWRRGPLYRKQVLTIVIGSLLPCIGNVLYLTNLTPFPHLDLSPFAFSLMGIAMIWVLFRYRLFNVVPVARDMLIENMGDGVLVLDTANRVVDINPAATALIGVETSSSIGQNIETLLSDWPQFLTACQGEEKVHHEITRENHTAQTLDLLILELTDRKGHQRGKLITLRDITPRKQLEAEREGLIHNLQEALAHVKTLNGLLPICSGCKNIRDDQGYWHQVEVYISNHSGADFSHGICPDCIKRLYPEYRKKDKPDTEAP
jgi:PAS domain S-box-containing protein